MQEFNQPIKIPPETLPGPLPKIGGVKKSEDSCGQTENPAGRRRIQRANRRFQRANRIFSAASGGLLLTLSFPGVGRRYLAAIVALLPGIGSEPNPFWVF